ncbi:MAG: DNA invertase [Pedosphaera sp.]|nr:DNA invertase [Pedosphaera sp.]
MKTKTFSYLRVSGKGQVDGDGFPRQRQSVTDYARRNRMEIVTEFRDEGVSGAAFDRPGLTELFVAIKADGVKVVLVEKADRLARDLVVSETLLAEFRKLGVKVVAADGGTDLTVDSDDPSRKMIRQILGVVSEWEKSCIVQKLRAARIRSKEKTGRCEGRKPFGQKEGETEIISKIQNLRNDRLTIDEIANRLNSEGIKTRSGGRWHFTQVRRILARL